MKRFHFSPHHLFLYQSLQGKEFLKSNSSSPNCSISPLFLRRKTELPLLSDVISRRLGMPSFLFLVVYLPFLQGWKLEDGWALFPYRTPRVDNCTCYGVSRASIRCLNEKSWARTSAPGQSPDPPWLQPLYLGACFMFPGCRRQDYQMLIQQVRLYGSLFPEGSNSQAAYP